MIRINWRFSLIFLLAFLLLIIKINKPFIGHHDWNGVFFGNVLRNTKKFGFWKTKFGAVYTFMPQEASEFNFYTHYPLGFRAFLGISTKFLGVSEFSMRLTAVLFSLLALYLFYRLTAQIFDWKIAFSAGLFFILNPMFLYFGKMPVHEVFGLPFIIWSFNSYLNYFQKKSKKNKLLLILSLFLACQTVWSAYYLTPLFIFHYWIFKKPKLRNNGFFFLLLIPVFCFLSYLALTYWQTASWHNNIFSTLLFRMQIGEQASRYQFTFSQYWKQQILWLTVYFSRIACFLALIYGLIITKKFIKKDWTYLNGLTAVIFIFPFIDLIIFPNLCFIHDYKLYYFLISLPLLAGAGAWYLFKKIRFFQKRRLAPPAALVFIFAFIILERGNYLKALIKSDSSRQAYDLANLIKQKTNPEDLILVASPSFGEHLEPFFIFYGQRKAIFFKPNLDDFKKLKEETNANWLVAIDNREKPAQNLWQFLETNYSYIKHGEFFLFDTRP